MAKGKAGNTKTEGGKSYVQTSSGLWVSADSDSGKKWSSGSSSKSSSSGNKSSSSKSSSSSSSKSSKPGVNPGQTKTERGKTYVQGANGGWYSMDDKYGQNVYNKYNNGSSSGSSGKGGYTQRTQVAGSYIDNSGNSKNAANNKGGYNGYTVFKNSKGEWGTGKEGYEYTGARTGTGKDPVARLKNGAMVGLSYISQNPDKDYYSLDYVAPNTAKNRSQISDSAKAYVDWNYGTDFGNSDYRYPYGSDEYNWVYDNLVAGRGMSGGALPADSPEYQAIWGSGSFNQAAYDSLLAQGRIAGKWDGSQNGATNYPAGYDSKGKANPMTGYGDSYLNQAMRAALDANEAATRRATAAYDGYRDDINSNAEDAARQAFIAMQQNKVNLPQQMAAMGNSGGLTESALLGLQTGYENDRNSIMKGANSDLAALDRQIAELEAQGDMNRAQIIADYRNRQYEAQMRAAELAAQQAFQQQQAQEEFERQKELLAYRNSLTGSGGSGGNSGLSTTDKWLYDNGMVDNDYIMSKLGIVPSAGGMQTLSPEGAAFDSAMQRNLTGRQAGYVSDQQLANDIKYAIESALNQGQISQSDARILANMYGIPAVG